MAIPEPPGFEPAWLAPASVKEWLRLAPEDTVDDALIAEVCAMAEPYVQKCRPEWFDTNGVYIPDAETYRGAVMYAAREYRRRNSPAGIEVFGDVASFVTRYDTDIERALRTGSWALPVIA